MSADLNAALANLREHADVNDSRTSTRAIHALLDAIPEGAVLVAITRDDMIPDGPGADFTGPAYLRLTDNAWAALEAQP